VVLVFRLDVRHPVSNLGKNILLGSEHVVTLLLVVFSIGIGIGSLLCERLSGHKVEIGLVPLGSIGLTLFALDLFFALNGYVGHGAAGIGEFRTHCRALAHHDRLAADRHVWRLLHRAALCVDPDPQRTEPPLAHHSRQQHPERAVHGRRGPARDRPCSSLA
jgi:hypothetical protein